MGRTAANATDNLSRGRHGDKIPWHPYIHGMTSHHSCRYPTKLAMSVGCRVTQSRTSGVTGKRNMPDASESGPAVATVAARDWSGGAAEVRALQESCLVLGVAQLSVVAL